MELKSGFTVTVAYSTLQPLIFGYLCRSPNPFPILETQGIIFGHLRLKIKILQQSRQITKFPYSLITIFIYLFGVNKKTIKKSEVIILFFYKFLRRSRTQDFVMQ
jgi:hypothetical protein